ncbi:2Fe-2S iron-sulfur cluster-binding protein [Paenibacillus tarimensis]|uniref:2Fe-2S iron-sulfur cluster-binding protein n=1 Tax=Paenibacillus tarimensis TaxID=416012 RepID=UPI001F1A45D6|nr:2Fe-2S iron-sulfur cluster-binding protein [Paenibacillus tarimensis]MCF2942533.1 2Fe-2S iron-sulfur cluster-binding protein [Paenibacillus tarimensis]
MAVTITFLPEGKSATVHPGTSVLEAARKARVLIKTRCGGKAGCLMCKVKDVAGEGLSGQEDRERRKLFGTAEGTRLSCQAKVVGNAVVEVPEDPLKSTVRKLLEKQREEDEGLW